MLTKAYIKLSVIFHKEDDGRWTAECKESGTASFGNTIEEAQTNIEEAICLHLEGLYEVGELERFFRENNITFHSRRPRTTTVDAPTTSGTFVRPQYYPLQQLGVC